MKISYCSNASDILTRKSYHISNITNNCDKSDEGGRGDDVAIADNERKRVSLVPVIDKSKEEERKTPEDSHEVSNSNSKTSHNPKAGCSTESQPVTDFDDPKVETTEEYNAKLKQIRTDS